MINRHNKITCFFIGAGASDALAGIPVQKRFLKKVLNNRCNWINRCKIKIGNQKPSEWIKRMGDIEFCMSHIHNMGFDNRDNPDWREYKKANINLRAAMVEVLRKIEFKRNTKKKFEELLKKEKNYNNSLVILTTTYDLIVEKLLEEINWRYYYPDIPTEPVQDVRGIRLYRLHGSINWLEEREVVYKKEIGKYKPWDLKAVDRPLQIICDNKIMGGKGKTVSDDHEKYRIFKDKNNRICTPIFIPFYFQKKEWIDGRWGDVLNNHWNSAKKYLLENEIEKFYFLGCGLPVADHYLFSWLMMIFKAKKLETKPNALIMVCKPKPTEQERLEIALGTLIKRDNIHKDGLWKFLCENV